MVIAPKSHFAPGSARRTGRGNVAPLAAAQTRPWRVFISYAHKDDPFRRELETHLSLLKQQNILKVWSDQAIGPGQEWEQSIHDALEAAEIILLLISPDFLASEYIYDKELKRAMERHEAGEARVIPVFLRPCDWKGAPFGKLQGVPDPAKPIAKWGSRDEAYKRVAETIRRAVETLRRSPVASTAAASQSGTTAPPQPTVVRSDSTPEWRDEKCPPRGAATPGRPGHGGPDSFMPWLRESRHRLILATIGGTIAVIAVGLWAVTANVRMPAVPDKPVTHIEAHEGIAAEGNIDIGGNVNIGGGPARRSQGAAPEAEVDPVPAPGGKP